MELTLQQTNLCLCGCGKPLRRKNQKFYQDACRYKAHGLERKSVRPFVGLDGEGIQDRYVLLASGNGTFIQARKGLSTEACLNFLVNRKRGSNSGSKPIYVWFAFDYDVNMILGDLPLRGENSIEQLRATNKVRYLDYTITYIPRKILRIRQGKRVHTSYDVWGFFQTSFEGAVAQWKLNPSPLLAEGKQSRSSFGNWPLKKIRAYNDEELRLLAELMELLREAAEPLQLPIQSWHGPAALAAAWLRKNRLKECIREPETEMADACVRAYFGGRIDALGYGYCSPIYHYDIVSAYPAAIRNLPDLTALTWKKIAPGKMPHRGSIYLARIRWEIPAGNWGVFPWRDKDGSILWPHKGHGWYWMPELEAAQDKHGDCYEILEGWEAVGEYRYPFRQLIEETFQYRAEMKKQNHPSHIPLKLILNSLYGKFAQTVGARNYHSPIWAGLITSYTRAELLRRITDDVVLCMTDSLWSRGPLDLPIGDALGEWELQSEQELWLAEAGLYQSNDFVWQRGYDKTNPVNITDLVSRWLDGELYEPVYTVNRFIGMGLALQTHYPWRHWLQLERRIQPVPLVGTTKRIPSFPFDFQHVFQPASRFVELQAKEPPSPEVLSHPYSRLVLQTDRQSLLERLSDECEE